MISANQEAMWGMSVKGGADGLDGLPHAIDLMGRQVIHDDDVARLQAWRQRLHHIGLEDGPIHRPIDDHRRGDGVFS